VNEVSRFNPHPVSWKSYGDVHVVSKVRVEPEAVPMWSDGPEKPKSWFENPKIEVAGAALKDTAVTDSKEGHGVVASLKLPERTLIDEAESAPVPTPDELAALRPEDREYFGYLHVAPHETPETFWSIGDGEGLDRMTGQWAHVLQSGKFEGYGHFAVRDTHGKVVMTLDVSKPERPHGLTLKAGGDMVKPQKVVPGWDGEE